MNYSDTGNRATKGLVFFFIPHPSFFLAHPSSFTSHASSLALRTLLASAGRAFAHAAVWYVDEDNTAGPCDARDGHSLARVAQNAKSLTSAGHRCTTLALV